MSRQSLPSDTRLRVLVFAPHTLLTRARSGIHRVTARLIEHLPAQAQVDLVKWDPIEGQLRYCDRADLRAFFHELDQPKEIAVHPLAHRVDYRFGDTLHAGERVIVLMPEVFYLIEDGNEIHARVIAQCTVYGWITAAIFYDLIPLKCPGYESRDAHARYVAELARVDVVLSISHYVDADLRDYFRETLGIGDADRAAARQHVLAIPLPDRDNAVTARAPDGKVRDTILLVGTIEPRKQQVRVIRAFKTLRLAERAGLRLVIIGGLNPRSEAEFRPLIEGDGSITWMGHATDAEVEEAFSRARFSVFASNEEGFGLPIAESLCRGVPCLTAQFGAMREVAEAGGCLMVDVDDDAAIERGLQTLALHDDVLDTCRQQILKRRWRTWSDYAREVVTALSRAVAAVSPTRAGAAKVTEPVVHYLEREDETSHRWRHAPDDLMHGLPAVDVLVVGGDADLPKSHGDHQGLGDRAIRIVVLARSVEPTLLSAEAFEAVVDADAWFCQSRSTYDQVVARAAASGVEGLLAGCCGWRAEPEALAALMAQRLAALFERRSRTITAAIRDAHFQSAWRRVACRKAEPTLTVVISTYNGAAFIERNVAHCLSLMKPLGGRVKLLVADNASTDDTRERLDVFVRESAIDYVRASCNTGLLGNLHFVSTHVLARHVWIIGVDDIIVPGALERILDVLDREPACPFVMPNFAVFHRERIVPEETCATFLGESFAVGRGCDPDGMMDVRRAASQHDNLLTAFYIIVFRSDLMAAVFNSPFTDPFFRSLVDTVPTTKVIFEAFPDFAAAWLSEPAVVGNAHNTWRHHRVAWHGILMPLVFELAREAGLDRRMLRRWSRQHIDLFREAESLYPDPTVGAAFPKDALEASFRVFGEHLLAGAAPP